MRYFYFTILVFCFSFSFAQLFVRNDAYVFAKDQVLFVEDHIILREPATKLYLRDDAQLIQGSGTTGNSGLGQLSVYQRGTVNAYAYNYWCSPVGYVLEPNNTVPLNTSINNHFKPNAILFEHTGHTNPMLDPITSTIANYTTSYEGTTSPFQISQRWIYSYDAGSQYIDWDFVGQNGTINPAHGFTMKGNPSANQLYDFRGKPNTGLMTATIVDGEKTLVGNPYPSALDALLFIHDPQNSGIADLTGGSGMSGALYYWEQAPGANSHNLDAYVGGYATYTISSGGIESFVNAPFTTYNSDGSVNTVGPTSGTKTAKRYIPIGQGFMIEGATGSGTSSVYFKNEHRVYYKQSGANSYFFRNSTNNASNETAGIVTSEFDESGNYIVPNDFKRFRINVDFNPNNSQFTKQLLMNFHHTATDGFDYGLEAKNTSEVGDTNAYWILNDEAYNIQAFNFREDLRIPLVIKVGQQQPLSFRIFDVQNFDASQAIYIHDLENNTYVNLRNQSYDINIPAGNYTERFEIVFTNQTLNIKDVNFSTLNIYQNNNLHQLSVHNPKGLDITTIEVFDTGGKRVIQAHFDSVENEYNLSTLRLSDGVYVVNVSSQADTKAKSQKIIVKN